MNMYQLIELIDQLEFYMCHDDNKPIILYGIDSNKILINTNITNGYIIKKRLNLDNINEWINQKVIATTNDIEILSQLNIDSFNLINIPKL